MLLWIANVIREKVPTIDYLCDYFVMVNAWIKFLCRLKHILLRSGKSMIWRAEGKTADSTSSVVGSCEREIYYIYTRGSKRDFRCKLADERRFFSLTVHYSVLLKFAEYLHASCHSMHVTRDACYFASNVHLITRKSITKKHGTNLQKFQHGTNEYKILLKLLSFVIFVSVNRRLFWLCHVQYLDD